MRYGLKAHLPLSARNSRRLMRREGEEPGQTGGTPTPSGDNTGGNVTPPAGDSTAGDNTGPAFDANAFWNPPPSGEGGGPSGNDGSVPPPTPNVGAELATALSAMDFGVPVMTPDMAKEMSEGNFASFQTAMTQHGQSVAKQTIRAMMPVLQAIRADILSKVNTDFKGELGNREDMAALHAAIPSAKNPAMAKGVTDIFNQAMKLTKGDRGAAITMTKSMLTLQANTMMEDTSLGLPPRSPGDSTGPKVNWLEELAGR